MREPASLLRERDDSADIGLLSIVYSVLSIAMVFTNKLILGSTAADGGLATLIVLISQCSFAAFALFILSFFISHLSLRVGLPDLAGIVFGNLFFIGTILANSNTLRYLSIHMVTLLKNTAIVFTAAGDRFWLHHSLSGKCWFAIGLILVGASCGVVTDLQFSLIGYVWMAVSGLCASGYVLLSKRILAKRNIHFFTILFWNNFLSTVFLAVWTVSRNAGLRSILTGEEELPFRLSLPLVLFSAVLGLALSVSTFSLLGKTSATSYVVVGVAKKLGQVLLSFVFFSKSVNLRNGVSVMIGLVGASLYAYVKWQEGRTEAKKADHQQIGLL
jgi:drug/metabolite transporter (DMT)-like permease